MIPKKWEPVSRLREARLGAGEEGSDKDHAHNKDRGSSSQDSIPNLRYASREKPLRGLLPCFDAIH
jgi:hypothetical protein